MFLKDNFILFVNFFLRNVLFIIFLIIISFEISAQPRPKHRKTTIARGTVFGYFGFNRSSYTKSDIQFVGPGYDFTTIGSIAYNSENKAKTNTLQPLGMPRMNAKIGYYFKNKYAFGLAFDHLKYIYKNQNQILLNGSINPGVDDSWSGNFNNEPLTTNSDFFHYKNDVNYIRFEFSRSDLLYGTQARLFSIASNLGVSAGPLVTSNDFTFGQKSDFKTTTLSGFGTSVHASLRLEFFSHFFLQGEISGGYLNQLRVRTRNNDRISYAKQTFFFGQANAVLGFLLYHKPKKKGCLDCPSW
jgi:hypothetical protein